MKIEPVIGERFRAMPYPNVLERPVVELDHCATNMMTVVATSFDYLTLQRLGHGRPK